MLVLIDKSMNKNNRCIGELLNEGQLKLEKYGNSNANQESELLLSYLLNRNKFYLYLNPNLPVTSKKIQQYDQWIHQISKGIPLQYITGFQNFMGLDFKVTEDVLIPRPETEILVEKIIQLINTLPKKDSYLFLDIGVGSVVIPVTVCHNLQKTDKDVYFYGIDISQKAIHLANENIKKYQCQHKINLYQGNLFQSLAEFKKPLLFDGIISNPPYIASDEWDELSEEITLHEPCEALYGGKDGLYFYREIIRQSPKFLKSNAFLALEIGHKQRNAIYQMLILNGSYKKDIFTFRDYYQNNRGIIAFVNTPGI